MSRPQARQNVPSPRGLSKMSSASSAVSSAGPSDDHDLVQTTESPRAKRLSLPPGTICKVCGRTIEPCCEDVRFYGHQFHHGECYNALHCLQRMCATDPDGLGALVKDTQDKDPDKHRGIVLSLVAKKGQRTASLRQKWCGLPRSSAPRP